MRKGRGLLVRYGGSGADVVGRGGRSFDATGGLERRDRRGGERDEPSLDLEEKSDRREEGSMVAGRAGLQKGRGLGRESGVCTAGSSSVRGGPAEVERIEVE